jgi:hypothetical protein
MPNQKQIYDRLREMERLSTQEGTRIDLSNGAGGINLDVEGGITWRESS